MQMRQDKQDQQIAMLREAMETKLEDQPEAQPPPATAKSASVQDAHSTHAEQIESIELQPQLLAVVIHRVMDEARELTIDDSRGVMDAESLDGHKNSADSAKDPLNAESNEDNWDEEADVGEELDVIRHSSYVGAALALYHRNLISLEDVIKVAKDAVEEFDKLRFIYSDWDKRWEAAEEDMRLDLDHLQARIQEAEAQENRIFPSLPPLLRTKELLEKTELILPKDESPPPQPTSRTSRQSISMKPMGTGGMRGSYASVHSRKGHSSRQLGHGSSSMIGKNHSAGGTSPNGVPIRFTPSVGERFTPSVVEPIPEAASTANSKIDIES